MKLTTLIAQQPYDLNLLVRAMDGEVRQKQTKITQFDRCLRFPQFIFTLNCTVLVRGMLLNDMLNDLCLFQPISFLGLDEREVAHFLCGLQRLNTIAEVQM